MADEILVLREGHVVERGTHLELMQRESLYWRLWVLQNRALIPVLPAKRSLALSDPGF